MRAFLRQDIGNDAAKKRKARLHIINPRRDHLVDPAPARSFGRQAGATVTLLDDDCGHAPIVCATSQIGPAIERAE